MDLYIPSTISKLYTNNDIGEVKLNFADNYVDPKEKLIMFNFEDIKFEFHNGYTHEVPDEDKSNRSKEITKIIDENYSGQDIKRIYMEPKENKDKYRFFD